MGTNERRGTLVVRAARRKPRGWGELQRPRTTTSSTSAAARDRTRPAPVHPPPAACLRRAAPHSQPSLSGYCRGNGLRRRPLRLQGLRSLRVARRRRERCVLRLGGRSPGRLHPPLHVRPARRDPPPVLRGAARPCSGRGRPWHSRHPAPLGTVARRRPLPPSLRGPPCFPRAASHTARRRRRRPPPAARDVRPVDLDRRDAIRSARISTSR